MSYPDDRKYTQTHEWVMEADGVVTIGLTSYAVDQLTDVTFAELQPVGTQVSPGDPVGEVESVKTSSDVYSPCGGEIIEVNDSLESSPETLNSDPHGEAWLVRVKISDRGTLDELLDAPAYTETAS